MKRNRHQWWIPLLLLGVAPLRAVLLPASAPAPFVQRVDVTDFLLLETNNDLALSPANQLVICFPVPDKPEAVARVVALRRDPSGRWLLSYLAAIPPGGPGQFRQEERALDPTIARNVVAVFRHLLEINVYAPTGGLHSPSTEDNAWIFLRDRTSAIAGVALTPAMHTRAGGSADEDGTVYRDLCVGLVGLFVAPPEEREEVLAQLDRFAGAYAESKKLVRR